MKKAWILIIGLTVLPGCVRTNTCYQGAVDIGWSAPRALSWCMMPRTTSTPWPTRLHTEAWWETETPQQVKAEDQW